MERLQFVLDLRKRRPIFAAEKIEYDGQRFISGGTGLEPVVKTKTVIKRLYAPLGLERVVECLN